MSFVQRNALRFRPQRTYDLVWSAGLFDYFEDALFVTTLSRLLKATAADGELVVGNFSTQNPSRMPPPRPSFALYEEPDHGAYAGHG